MELLLKLSRDILKKGKSVRFQAKGWSMRPFIQDGDFLVVRPIENSSIKIGDVALYFTSENKVIVHRVIKKYKKDGRMTILIKGDATFGSPESVNVQNVLGKVVEIERNGRKKRLESKRYQIINEFLSGISPFSRWVYPVGSRIKQGGRMVLGGLLERLHSPKFYCILIKKIIKRL